LVVEDAGLLFCGSVFFGATFVSLFCIGSPLQKIKAVFAGKLPDGAGFMRPPSDPSPEIKTRLSSGL
jgi:hypothetical protein